MAEPTPSHRAPEPRGSTVNPWATGLVIFAGVIMIMVGGFQIITGLAAVLDDDFYVVSSQYAFDLDVTAWGWLHIIVGAVILLAGFAVFTGRLWARIVGIVLALISAVANFFFIPYFPVWALAMIALDVFVIWALSVYDGGRSARIP